MKSLKNICKINFFDALSHSEIIMLCQDFLNECRNIGFNVNHAFDQNPEIMEKINSMCNSLFHRDKGLFASFWMNVLPFFCPFCCEINENNMNYQRGALEKFIFLQEKNVIEVFESESLKNSGLFEKIEIIERINGIDKVLDIDYRLKNDVFKR